MEVVDNRQRLKKRSEGTLVVPPLVHQGVADALRAAFTPERQLLPDDMAALLHKLR
jgi:hypothetical protein